MKFKRQNTTKIEKSSTPRSDQESRNTEAVKTRVMSFTSGKGGVGKTHLISNIAISLAERGREVLVVDADLGLANVDIVLGLQVERTLHDFLEGRCSLEDLIIEGPEGIHIIPASSGVESILQLTQYERQDLLAAIESLAHKYDYLLIDTPAGIGSDVLSFNGASNEIVCVITPEPTSLTDAYALIKVLSRRFGERSIRVLVNNATSEKQAKSAFERFDEVVHQYLQVELDYLGWVQHDDLVGDAVRKQRPFTKEYPSCGPSRAVRRIAESIDLDFYSRRITGGVQFFFRQLLDFGDYGTEKR